ncbi:major facilitator superfamily domain-containing protein [Ilyonectria destructans]|nr:major facilitator superfamily domain-containing protein [Ilyonectria destructans]
MHSTREPVMDPRLAGDDAWRKPSHNGGCSPVSNEKDATEPIDNVHAENASLTELPSLKEQKRITRRIDLRLLPILGIMYSVSLIDRTNLGLALVAGMQGDFELAVGNRYTIVVMVFFVAYILCEIPSNLILPKAGPANWLAFLGLGFGAILIGMGFTRHWGTLALCRALLGVMEAGFLPGCTYLITCWYTRYEIGKRLSAFWILSVIASGFANILAYALSRLDGKAGLGGWRWIFIIEGAATCVICIVGWFIIVDFPSKADKFLSPSEQEFVIRRLNADRGDAIEDKVTVAVVLHHLKDWKLYCWAFNLMASSLPGYAYSYFLPIILRDGMGYSGTDAMLLSAPPFVIAAILALISGWLGDKLRIRGPIIATHQALTATGMLITVYGKSNAVRYFGACLGLGFFQFCVPGVIVFQANNITSHSKRAVASATCLIGGGTGGIIASVAFMAKENPHYTTGVWVTCAISVISITLIVIMDIYFWRRNKAAKGGTHLNEDMEGWMYTL